MSLVLGTATPGGGFPVYGDAVAATLNEVDPALDVTTRNTKGSTENVPLLESGALGVGRPPATLTILAAMYSTPGMFVVRADAPACAIDDLRGRPVVFGARGSGLVILARYVLDGLGLDQTRDFAPIFLDRAGDGHRGEATLAARLPQARETTAANTLAAAPRRELIHAGVLRYLKEIGLT
ncbi:MAG: hypothetical protein E6K82_14525 [Candidatus Rokuibacteriota bacterium]|nr:MAG: hypothetical protein E6K82_14525 [Candidatus Rokubacteria bacterium]